MTLATVRLLQGVLLALILFNSSAWANQSLSQKTYESLSEIQQYIQQQNYSEAEELINELESDLTPGFALALTYQTHAQLYNAQDNSRQALNYFNKALDLNALKPSQALSLATNVAQLYLSSSQPDRAIKVLESRIAQAEQEKAGSTMAMAYITLGSAFQVKKDFQSSIPWLLEGVSRSQKPRENWLQMLMAAHYQIKQYTEAVAVLDKLIVINPEKEDYWLQQASLYQLLGKPDAALITLNGAYVKGVLNKENGLILFTQLLINESLPEYAGRTLQHLLSNQKIELSEDNLRLMASAWLQGKERPQAIQGLIRAAQQAQKDAQGVDLNKQEQKEKKQGGAKLYYRAAQLAFEVGDYKTAAQQYQNARDLGLSGNQYAFSLLMQGNAYFELQNYSMARVYFSKAQKEPRTTAAAKSWLDYMKQLEVI